MSKVVFKKESEIEKSHKCDHNIYEYFRKEITNRSEFSQIHASFYEVPPQKSAYPFHYHENVTELFYIISGKGLVRTKDEKRIVESGDIFVFPPGEEGAHRISNISETSTLVYLDVASKDVLDIIHYPDSKKIGVIKNNSFAKFYKEEEDVDYYQDE